MKQENKSPNTISFYMRNLRAIYNKAIKKGLFKPSETNIFNNVYTGLEITPKRALIREEIIKLFSKKDLEPSLLKARHFFLFSFLTRGMSFVDMAYLQKGNIENDILVYHRKKTGQRIEITLTAQIKYLISCFKEETAHTQYIFPIIKKTNISERLQYESALSIQNKRLKKLAKACDINKILTTHVARHSWASIAKMENLPLAVISEGLGHTSIKTTSIYLAPFNRKILEQANKKVTQLINHMI